jgi:hypothetical protein
MRNTTKLKHILLKYSLHVEMEEERFIVLLTDKDDQGKVFQVEEKSWSSAMAKCYSVLLRELKKEGV